MLLKEKHCIDMAPAAQPLSSRPYQLQLVLLGLNHQTASVALRECVAFMPEEQQAVLAFLAADPAVAEVVLLSTCNRVELLMALRQREQGIEAARRCFAVFKQIAPQDLEQALYIHEGDQAVRHLFRVTASLDSMMVGEPQISGQVKTAYSLAVRCRTTGVLLNRLLHKAFLVAKRIRNETGIGDHAVSISYAAVELARKIFGTLDNKAALLIGAGEMAELAVLHLVRNGCGCVHVANRTFERAHELAQRFRGHATPWENLFETLEEVDIVISSTGAPGYILTADRVRSIMVRRRQRPLFLIDIAVPRDIDPQINRLNNVYVYDIDDLQGVINENIEDRRREALKAEALVEEAVDRYRNWRNHLKVVPTIVALRRKMETIANAELQKTAHALKHLNEDDYQAVERMLEAVIKKCLHDPTLYLKRCSNHGDTSRHLDVARKLFNLDQDAPD